MAYIGGVYHDLAHFGMTAEEFVALHPDWTKGSIGAPRHANPATPAIRLVKLCLPPHLSVRLA